MFRFQIDNISVDKIEGDIATATVIYHFKTVDNIPNNAEARRRTTLLAEEKTETLTLELGTFSLNPEKIWQIVPFTEQPAEPMLDGKSGFLGYAAYMLAQKQGPDAQLHARPTRNNLTQLGLGVLQFVQDWDERFAFAPEYARQSLMPYVRSNEVFLIPGSREPHAFNGHLSDKTWRKSMKWRALRCSTKAPTKNRFFATTAKPPLVLSMATSRSFRPKKPRT